MINTVARCNWVGRQEKEVVRMILPAWFDRFGKGFLIKKFSLNVLPTCENQSPSC